MLVKAFSLKLLNTQNYLSFYVKRIENILILITKNIGIVDPESDLAYME